MRTTRILLATAVLGLSFTASAMATSGSGQQNPDLLVTIDFHSSNANPDIATSADTWSADETVTNETDQPVTVTVIEKLKAQTTELTRVVTKGVEIDAGATVTLSHDWGSVGDLAPGKYRATITANDGNGRSRAYGRVTVVTSG